MRNIRTLALADQKFRAEEDVERAMLDEREMQYLYNDGDTLLLHGHVDATSRSTSRAKRSATRRTT